MNVSGIRPTAGFYQYNSIKLNEIRNQQITAAQNSRVSDSLKDPEEEQRLREEQAAIAARQTFNSYEYAQQFKPDEEFDLKGADSDLASLDVAKAVSDLDKDQLLQRYQVFVGEKQDTVVKAEMNQNVSVRMAENFSL